MTRAGDIRRSRGASAHPRSAGKKITICGACGTVHRGWYDRRRRRARDLCCAGHLNHGKHLEFTLSGVRRNGPKRAETGQVHHLEARSPESQKWALALGRYGSLADEMGAERARELAAEARAQLKVGRDPMGDRRRGPGRAGELAPRAGRGVGRQAALGAAHGTAGAADPGALAAGAREPCRLERTARRYPAGAP